MTKQNEMVPWEVFLNGKAHDTVYYTADCDRLYVYDSLVDHDGYDPNIIVVKEEKQPTQLMRAVTGLNGKVSIRPNRSF